MERTTQIFVQKIIQKEKSESVFSFGVALQNYSKKGVFSKRTPPEDLALYLTPEPLILVGCERTNAFVFCTEKERKKKGKERGFYLYSGVLSEKFEM